MNRTIALLAAAALLFLTPLARGDAPPAADAYGDPLPPGAVARAGTVRLRPATGSNVVWSRDGRLVAAASNGDVRLWDATTGKLARVLPGGHDESVDGVAISPDGRMLAAASSRVRLFDLPTGKVVREIAAAGVQSLSFSPDGKTLMAVLSMGLFGESSRPAFWNVSTGAEVRKPRLGEGTAFLGMAPGGEAAVWADRRSRLISLPPAAPDVPPRWIEFDRVAGLSADGEVLAVGKGGFTAE